MFHWLELWLEIMGFFVVVFVFLLFLCFCFNKCFSMIWMIDYSVLC